MADTCYAAITLLYDMRNTLNAQLPRAAARTSSSVCLRWFSQSAIRFRRRLMCYNILGRLQATSRATEHFNE
jgi:hypothetical protein